MSKLFYPILKAIPLFFIVLFGMSSCTPSNEFPKKERRDEIHFGQGGGFTGAVTHFVLLEDGRLFQQAWKDSTMTYLDTWPGLFTRQMFLNYKSLHLDATSYNEPGDLYYFIEYHSKNKPPNRMVWGKTGFYPDQNVITYYNTLYRSTKPKS